MKKIYTTNALSEPAEGSYFPYRVLAIDPGETCGVAKLMLRLDGKVQAEACTMQPWELFAEFNTGVAYYDAVVIEEFRLYPGMAGAQFNSTFPTVEAIGVLKYLSSMSMIPFYMQKAQAKKPARKLCEDAGLPMVERTLGSGRRAYKGLDIDYSSARPCNALGRVSNGKCPTCLRKVTAKKDGYPRAHLAELDTQHPRDALVHGFYWVWRNPQSPLYAG